MKPIPSDFNEHISKNNCVVKFTASWCAPCKALNPVLDRVEKDTGVEILFADIDHHPDLVAKYGISSVPTVVAFKDGEPTGALVGAREAKSYLELIESITEHTGE